MMMLSGCVSTDGRVIKAATVEGRAKARDQTPEEPATCTKHMERVAPKVGDKARWIQAQWEVNADAIDLQIDNCAAYHRDLKARKDAH